LTGEPKEIKIGQLNQAVLQERAVVTRKHMEFIFNSLEVGMDSSTDIPAFDLAKSITNDFPQFNPLYDLEPNIAHGVVKIEGEDYIITVKKAEVGDPSHSSIIYSIQPGECPKSTHGRHTWSNNHCIGCGAEA
jgi:hypothetical protein